MIFFCLSCSTSFYHSFVSAGSGGQAAEVEAGDVVVVDRIEHLKIMTIGINRPKKRNCVNEVGQSPATAFAVFFGN